MYISLGISKYYLGEETTSTSWEQLLSTALWQPRTTCPITDIQTPDESVVQGSGNFIGNKTQWLANLTQQIWQLHHTHFILVVKSRFRLTYSMRADVEKIVSLSNDENISELEKYLSSLTDEKVWLLAYVATLLSKSYTFHSCTHPCRQIGRASCRERV